MTLTACSVLIALTFSMNTGDTKAATSTAAPAGTLTSEAAAVPVAQALRVPVPVKVAAWMIDQPERRPAALPVLYASLGALQAMDAWSTRRAVASGAREANPLMRSTAGKSGAMLAAKAISTAGAIFFAERAWKKNRKGAVILMVVINSATAAVSAYNIRNAQRR